MVTAAGPGDESPRVPVDGPARRGTLIVVGGLPASGKSSVAAAYAEHTRTLYLRVDRIEQALVDWSPLTHPVGVAGYAVSYALAAEQLGLGLDVVAECVNPISATRDAWRDVAAGAHAALVEVEMICSDPIEHRRRVESRPTDVAGLDKPDWAEVSGRDYEPWTRDHLVLDSAALSVPETVQALVAAVAAVASAAAVAAVD